MRPEWKKTLRSTFCLLALILLAGFSAVYAQTPVFGPEEYVRETGAPNKITKSFSIANPDGEFTLVVQNGEGKRGRVSSAVVEINGVPVVGPNSFNKNVDAVTRAVTLKPQNDLTVELRSAPGTSVTVTILGSGTPPPSPVSGVTADPDGFPVDTPTQVTFTATIPYPPGGSVPLVELEQVSQDGSVLAVEGIMVDNGQLSLGDEIQGDGVFSFRKTYTIPQPGEVRLRIKATLEGQVLYSDIFTLAAFIPVSEGDADAINELQTSAEQLYHQLLPTVGQEQALAEVLALLKAQPIVQDAGISVSSPEGAAVWIEYKNGMEGGISFHPPGTKGGPARPSMQMSFTAPVQPMASPAQPGNIEVESKKVLILAAFLDEFGAGDDGPAVKTIYENHNSNADCPQYDIVYLENGQVGVGSFKALGKYGVVHISSHGSLNHGRVVVYTKTSSSHANLATYQADLNAGRLVIETINGRTWLAATPAFFTYYIKAFPSSLVFVSSCFSTFNNGLSNAILGKGARTFLGFSDLVPVPFALAKSQYFHEAWIDDPVNLITTGQIFNNGCQAGACWNLMGANNLEAPSGGLRDGGFESGALGAWSADGDGRIIPQLGIFPASEGTRMGLVSTGLGFTVSSGSLEQKACIPASATTIEFDWNFISEEFREYCGSIYQDFFSVDLIADNGATMNVFRRKVDDVCGATFQVPFSFDQGDAWSTGWSTESADISAFAAANGGKSVTVRFSAGDVGDSIYDTAILIDDIKINN